MANRWNAQKLFIGVWIKYYNMTTIRVPMRTREQIRALADEGESVSDTIYRLVDAIEPSTCSIEGSININLSDDTYELIQSKKADGESLVKVIERAIYMHNK